MCRHATLPILTAAMMSLYAAPAEAQFVLAYVSASGTDNVTCGSFNTPCRTFQFAHDHADVFGTIVCRDNSNFGRVFIIKSITIDCEGTGAGTYAAGNQITVNGSNIVVTLRNITISPSSLSVGLGTSGIHFFQGAMLKLHNVNIVRMTNVPGI